MAPTPNPFWAEVRAQATAGVFIVVITAICGGIGYLIHTVPRQLDQVLDNQQMIKSRVDIIERRVDDVIPRVIRLEARP